MLLEIINMTQRERKINKFSEIIKNQLKQLFLNHIHLFNTEESFNEFKSKLKKFEGEYDESINYTDLYMEIIFYVVEKQIEYEDSIV